MQGLQAGKGTQFMEITITDLIGISTLQKIQDSFSDMTGMASLTTDADGNPVTVGSHFTDYCEKYTRQSPIGCARCRECDRRGAAMVLQTGTSCSYACHSGLVDFAAPIMANGRLVGCFIGGQVLTKPLSKQQVQKTAEELDIPFEEYWDALQKVPVYPQEKVDKAAHFLYTISEVLSDMAYSKYEALRASEEIELASNMKSDFLASMSHEIRTPMNAVLGMAEMAMREELPPAARNYISQIKSSGKILLNIINDILDFSKIESGKMDIIPVEYNILSVCDDVANIIETRLKDKRVELLMSIQPDIPKLLYGDSIRVRQILINIANNAAKFTQKGKIEIFIDKEPIDNDNILLRFTVTDTGCGIKEKDIAKIFDSFQQVDSKRNRNAEGTGLGLAICQKLLTLMNGSIQVESEYEKGSTFTVTIPQHIVDPAPVIYVEDLKQDIAIGYFRSRYLARHFFACAGRMNLFSIAMTAPDRIDWGLQAYAKECAGKKLFLFTDEKLIDEDLLAIPKKHPEITIVELTSFFSDKKPKSNTWRCIRKPLSEQNIAMALSGTQMQVIGEEDDSGDFDFIAPDARVLIVYDNEINLTVTEGLLKPLRMKVTSVTSGIEAVDLIDSHPFDLIFMDHMMPELDGIETTRIIRRFHPQYDKVPIIALTANAMDGMEEVFLQEGMNDFVAKPIEVRTLIQKVRKWLPKEQIIPCHTVIDVNDANDVSQNSDTISIEGLDTDAARNLLGNDELFQTVLKEYYRTIPERAKRIGQLKQQGDIRGYTIEVHTLKSTSRQIGAMELADLAAQLEQAGNHNDLAMIRERTDEMLRMYTDYSRILAPYCEEQAPQLPKISFDKQAVYSLLSELSDAVSDLDIDRMEELQQALSPYDFDDVSEPLYQQLCEAIQGIDVDTCDELLTQWKELLDHI